MQANLVPTELLALAAQNQMTALEDMTNVAAVVALVDTDFVPSDSTTWPAAAANFPLKTASGIYEIERDAVTGKDFLVAPDPAGGWDFISTGAGAPIVGFIVRGTLSTDRAFANKFTTPIPVGAAGVHINLPWVAADITQTITPAESPIPAP